MPLTDAAIRKSKPAPKARKLSDGGGLFLLIAPTGGKLWRLKYRFGGKEKLLALGAYPHVTLARAREQRDEAKRQLAAGIDPGQLKKAVKSQQVERAANSFEAGAREWVARHLAERADSHRSRVVSRLERCVFPYLGARPVAEITAPEVLAVARRIESRGAIETAHRALQNVGQVLRYAVATGRAVNDPTAALRGALTPAKPQHMAAPADDPARVGEILRAVEAFKGGPVVHAALRLLPLLFCRPGELRTMCWADVDIDAAAWRFTTSKTRTEHLAPLSRQALAILRDLHPLTGHGRYVFPSARGAGRPMSDAAINAAYRRLGIDTRTELTGHGWRAVARTLLHERLGFAAEVIEHQLAHAVPDALGRAYNRTKFIDERRRMMQAWADHLDRLKSGADVVTLRRAGSRA
jgi:integrase